MKRLSAGVQSSNFPNRENESPSTTYNGLYKGIVININPPEVAEGFLSMISYDVLVTGGFMSGQVLTECMIVTPLGGVSGYQERTLRALSTDLEETDWDDHDGDEVFVQFLNGDKNDPVIIGCDYSKAKSRQIGIDDDEAPKSTFEYNGVEFSIDKKGALEASVHGGKADSKNGGFTKKIDAGDARIIAEKDKIHLRVGSNEESSLTLDKKGITRLNGVSTDLHSTKRIAVFAGNIKTLGSLVIDELKDKQGKAVLFSDHIFLDGKFVSISIQGTTVNPSITMAQKAFNLSCGTNTGTPKISMTSFPNTIKIESSGSVVEIDSKGNIKVSSKVGTVSVEGKAVEIKGNTNVDIKSTNSINISGTADVNIKGAMVKLGAGSESLIKGESFLRFMQSVVTHTHVGAQGPVAPSNEIISAWSTQNLSFLSPTVKS